VAESASEQLFRSIDGHLRTPSVAEIGGFRPQPGLKSSFGGNFWLPAGEEWPQSHGKPMLPLLQVVIDELPVCPPALQAAKVLQVFADQDELPIDLPAKNGDRFLVITRRDEPLEPTEPPFKFAMPRPFQVRWLGGAPEGPSWEEAGAFIEPGVLDEFVQLDDCFELYSDRYYGASSTKVGGWATYIQGVVDLPGEFIFQIASEEKPRWMIGDNGNMYFYLSRGGEWLMSWDCY
jgi:hypothetical protein